MHTDWIIFPYNNVFVLVLQVADELLKVLLGELTRTSGDKVLRLRLVIESYVCLFLVTGILLVHLGVVFYRQNQHIFCVETLLLLSDVCVLVVVYEDGEKYHEADQVRVVQTVNGGQGLEHPAYKRDNDCDYYWNERGGDFKFVGLCLGLLLVWIVRHCLQSVYHS